MIHELRTYTLHPGKLPAFLDLAANVSRPVRGDAYGKLHGYWVSEFGTLNQVWHLWEYASLDERARLRLALAANERWRTEYVAKVQPLMVRQDIRLLEPVRPVQPPDGAGHLYEVRIYRANVGKARPWANLFNAIMPVRERYSRNVGIWMGEAPQPNEIVHMWAYPDLNIRAKTRAEVAADPKWQEFLREAGGMLAEMQNTLLLPTAFSPMK
ncbi:MAG TPA: NIPSNAP family protein [Acetobacteraceae bacterium]|nr:NIPSNAP family protein [Acetobacteraceae bacterium]